MNAKIFASLTAAAATTVALSSFAAPAQAFSFGTSGIQFDTDTTVNFNFVESHGMFTSALNIFEASDLTKSVAKLFWETKQSDNTYFNEWKGTFGNAVTSADGNNSASFTFKAGVSYVLGLASTLDGNSQGTMYSTSSLNTASGGTQQAVFGNATALGNSLNTSSTSSFTQASNFTAGNPFAGNVMIAFDDRGNGNDADFQDFIVKAEAVPEPLTMGGIALAGAGLTYARRFRKRMSA